MAWTRWSTQPDSRLYVYANVNGGFTCLGCLFQDEIDGSVNVPHANDMVNHIRLHMEAHRFIPSDRLRRLMDTCDALVEAGYSGSDLDNALMIAELAT